MIAIKMAAPSIEKPTILPTLPSDVLLPPSSVGLVVSLPSVPLVLLVLLVVLEPLPTLVEAVAPTSEARTVMPAIDVSWALASAIAAVMISESSAVGSTRLTVPLTAVDPARIEVSVTRQRWSFPHPFPVLPSKASLKSLVLVMNSDGSTSKRQQKSILATVTHLLPKNSQPSAHVRQLSADPWQVAQPLVASQARQSPVIMLPDFSRQNPLVHSVQILPLSHKEHPVGHEAQDPATRPYVTLQRRHVWSGAQLMQFALVHFTHFELERVKPLGQPSQLESALQAVTLASQYTPNCSQPAQQNEHQSGCSIEHKLQGNTQVGLQSVPLSWQPSTQDVQTSSASIQVMQVGRQAVQTPFREKQFPTQPRQLVMSEGEQRLQPEIHSVHSPATTIAKPLEQAEQPVLVHQSQPGSQAMQLFPEAQNPSEQAEQAVLVHVSQLAGHAAHFPEATQCPGQQAVHAVALHVRQQSPTALQGQQRVPFKQQASAQAVQPAEVQSLHPAGHSAIVPLIKQNPKTP